MTREEKCISLELAKLLKEAGMKQESESYWLDNSKHTHTTLLDYLLSRDEVKDYFTRKEDIYSAFDSDELWLLLPGAIEYENAWSVLYAGKISVGYDCVIDFNSRNKLSEALAQLKLWVIEQGYEKVEEKK